jgi:hypothetical protein
VSSERPSTPIERIPHALSHGSSLATSAAARSPVGAEAPAPERRKDLLVRGEVGRAARQRLPQAAVDVDLQELERGLAPWCRRNAARGALRKSVSG